MRRRLVTLLAMIACLGGGGAFASTMGDAPRGDRFALLAPAVDDSLLAAAAAEPAAAARARLWTRLELEALAARVRDGMAVGGALDASVRLVLRPGEGSSPGEATLGFDAPGDRTAAGPTANSRSSASSLSPATAAPRTTLRAAVRVEGDSVRAADYARAFDRAAGGAGRGRLAAVASGVAAVRDLLLESAHYAGDASVDSIVPAGAVTWVHLRVRTGGAVTLESFELEGAKTTRPSAAAAIAGVRRGDRLRPAKIEAARDRLLASELFAVVGDPRVAPGSAPDRARIVVPVEESRSSRFEGVLGAAQGGGVTGALDLALENIAGTGRAAGLRWAGLGAAGTEYAVRYREPALFGRPLDASVGLEAHVVDSLFTRTRWAVGAGLRAASRGRVSLAFTRNATTYAGAARGTNSDWTASAGLSWRALAPAANPRSGFALSLGGDGGRRREVFPGFPVLSRPLARGAFAAEGALPRGRASAFYASARAAGTSLGGDAFPAEELLYVGGNEGLRGHRERAFAGSRVAAFTLEHRWITDPAGGRAYLFADAAWHELARPLAAGTSAPGSAAAALARTELSGGWDFGYGAGLRTRAAAGTVGVELGLRPGASLGAATIHLRYGSRW
ncbi:MAG TPA: hypothetical protein VFU59_04185 [Candidatus Eisenbacteria bacterium]|nr:hypothetical protein [Candidatus Eisenbacteria bacterium]